MISKIPTVGLITLVPGLELRASIPYGLFALKLPLSYVIITAFLTNIILGIATYFFLDKFVHYFLRYHLFAKLYYKTVGKIQRRVHKYVEKFGILGVSLFIGIPLPGSGSYSGAIGAYALGLGFKKFIIANILGVLIAGTLVTLASLGILNLGYLPHF